MGLDISRGSRGSRFQRISWRGLWGDSRLTKSDDPVINKAMNPYSNLPPEQRATQRLVDQFNADERLWKKLEPKRAARRKSRPRLPPGKLKKCL